MMDSVSGEQERGTRSKRQLDRAAEHALMGNGERAEGEGWGNCGVVAVLQKRCEGEAG